MGMNLRKETPTFMSKKELQKESVGPVSDEEIRLDFDALYKRYPRKEGRKRGMEILRKSIKTEAEYQAFAGAMDNYLALCKREKREAKYLLHWKTFVNNWTDYLQEIEAAKPEALSQMERILKGDL